MTRAPSMAQRSQRTAIQYSGLPRTRMEASSMMMAHGITVISIQSV